MCMRTFILAVTALALPAPALAQTVDLKEWPVPWTDTRPRDPFVDGQGRVWFVGQEGNYIAYLEPKSGEFKRFTIEDGTYPHNLIVDRAGIVWYAGNRNARIGRLDPIFKARLPVREAQIIQEALNRVRVRYIPADDFTPDAEDQAGQATCEVGGGWTRPTGRSRLSPCLIPQRATRIRSSWTGAATSGLRCRAVITWDGCNRRRGRST